MVPENVTDVAMTPAPAESRERLAQLRRGEAFEDLLRANGASKDAADAILAAFGVKRGESPVAEGQKIILQYDDVEAGKPATIARVSVYADEQLKSTIAINDEGVYVPVTLPRAAAQHNDADADNGGVSLYESFYETALKQGLPKPIIDEMVRAFANDVDFQRSTQPGDAVAAFVAEPDEIDPRPQLLFASMTVRDQVFKYYRFQTPDDGLVDFYDENGRSVRKFLIRKPIAAGEMTSPFGMRYHPILHYARMHTGVDWGAPIGTPIVAAGTGVVIKAEFTSGYGRRVEIQHANGYVTTYNHMSGFARGIVAGVHVTQGQVDRLSRPVGPGHRPASALRSHHQRQFRRPDGDQARAHARVRRQDARLVQARARPHRAADDRGAERRLRRPDRAWRRVAGRRLRRRQGQLSRTAKRGAPGAKPSATRRSSAVAP